MNTRLQPLPPLKTLPAFEAVARLQSVSLAAIELNLSQGAVSRQIGNLEARLGLRLFERKRGGLRLTAEGERYLLAVREALSLLTAATARLQDSAGQGPVTIGASSALAALWLMPRLTGLRTVEPDLPIRVLASDFHLPDTSDQIDLVISYSRSGAKPVNARRLFDECVFPVCSPDLLADVGPLDSLDAVLAQTLLIHDDDHPDWIGWDDWLNAMGRAGFKPGRALRVNAYSMVLQAAVAGQGVALGWQHLVDDHLAAGTLVALPIGRLQTDGGFFLRSLRQLPDASPAARLRDWLLASAGDGALLSPVSL